MREFDWIFLPRENTCAKFYVIITSLISSKRLSSLIYNVQYLKLSFPKNTLKLYFKYIEISDKLRLVWDTTPQLLASEGKRALTCSRPTEWYM